MKRLMTLLFAADVGLALVSWMVLPDQVAMHFGAQGLPDAWGSSNRQVLAVLAIMVSLYLCLLYCGTTIRKGPAQWMSLPNREYWLSPENMDRAVQIMEDLVFEFGAALFGFAFFAGLLALEANLSTPVRLNETVLWVGLGVFLAYTIWWTVRLVLAFRIPEGGKPAGS